MSLSKALNLVILPEVYAVCKFSSKAALPQWVEAIILGQRQQQQQQLQRPVRFPTPLPHKDSQDNNQHGGDNNNGLTSSFLSVTRTQDELSIVCCQSLLASSTNNTVPLPLPSLHGDHVDPPDHGRDDHDRGQTTALVEAESFHNSVERDWCCFQVLGPLDFGLTGILAQLSTVLANAQISIFAISTYDTDYILVRQYQRHAAQAALEKAGYSVQSDNERQTQPSPIGNQHSTANDNDGIPPHVVAPAMTSSSNNNDNRPSDGPAETFDPDPIVARLMKQLHHAGQHQHHHHHRDGIVQPQDGTNVDDDVFGLAMVTMWPPDRRQLLEPYYRFRAAVELCFDDTDVVSDFGQAYSQPPPVYLYPFEALHITIATLHPFDQPRLANVEEEVTLTKHWQSVMDLAGRDARWPHKPLELRAQSAQIGHRAGIILWQDQTNGIDSIRQCIRSAVEQLIGAVPAYMLIPKIIHTTFVRFYQAPQTPGRRIQERFQSMVLPQLSTYFPRTIHVPVVRLVCERTPYMHIPVDERHVLQTYELIKALK